MRTRDQKSRIHFTEEELRDLEHKAETIGLDRSKYVRKVVLAAEVDGRHRLSATPCLACKRKRN